MRSCLIAVGTIVGCIVVVAISYAIGGDTGAWIAVLVVGIPLGILVAMKDQL